MFSSTATINIRRGKKVKLDWKNATLYHIFWHGPCFIHHSILGSVRSLSRHTGPRHVAAESDGVSFLKMTCERRTLSDLQHVKSKVVLQRYALAPQISRLAVSIRLLTPKFNCFAFRTPVSHMVVKGEFVT